MSKRLLSTLIIAAAGVSQAVQAQALGDPTRPPADPSHLGASGAEMGSGSRLQSILLSPGRKIAVIDGQEVPLGGKAGNAVLVRMSSGEVVLREGAEETTLKLYPAVEKKPVRTAAGGAPREGGRP